jgi:ABC-type polysaccharide/polyol phosphate export permease
LNSISDLWKIKSTILFLSITELKLKYRGAVLGFFWSVLEPLAQLGILYLVFSALRSADETFVIYLFSGLIMIHLFSRTTVQGMNSLVNKKSIIVSLNIKKIIFPLSGILTILYMIGIEVGIFFLFVIILKIEITYTILQLPFIFGLLIIFSTGVSLLLSIIRLYFKDIQSIWGIVVMSLIFITPVFWHVKDMPSEIASLFLLNPLAMMMEMAHKVILYGTLPTTNEYVYAIVSSFVVLLLGWVVFGKTESKIVEKL